VPWRLTTPALLLVLWAVMVFTAVSLRVSLAVFTSSASNIGSALATDTLAPPTGLTASGGASIDLTWTATTTTYASGYHILRGTAAGGPYTEIAQLTPRTAVSLHDNPAPGTYYYVVRAYLQNWESVDSNEDHADKN
jgi:hypothetical protein